MLGDNDFVSSISECLQWLIVMGSHRCLSMKKCPANHYFPLKRVFLLYALRAKDDEKFGGWRIGTWVDLISRIDEIVFMSVKWMCSFYYKLVLSWIFISSEYFSRSRNIPFWICSLEQGYSRDWSSPTKLKRSTKNTWCLLLSSL